VIDCEATPEVQCFTGSTDSGQCLSGAYQINNSPWIWRFICAYFRNSPSIGRASCFREDYEFAASSSACSIMPRQRHTANILHYPARLSFSILINTHAVVREIAAALPTTGIADTGS
jgi:hypothetical protein